MADRVDTHTPETGNETLWQQLEKLDTDKRSKFSDWLQNTFWAENYSAIRESRLTLSQEQLTSLREEASQDYVKIIFDSLETWLEIYKNSKLTPKLFKSHLEMISRFEESKKQFFLSTLLSKLNEVWFWISWVDNNWKIVLTSPSQKWIWVEVGPDELEAYSNHLNNFIKANWKLLLFQALLYKTTWVENFKSESEGNNKLSINNYAVRLLRKYTWLQVKWPEWDNLEPEQIVKYLWTKGEKDAPKWTLATTDEDFTRIRNTLLESITNPADKDFLRVYFDTLRQEWPRWKTVSDTKIIEKFDQNRSEMLKELQNFDEKTLAHLWIRSEDEFKDMQRRVYNDPGAGFAEIVGKWWPFWFLIWLLWWFFWWKESGFSWKRFLIWTTGWTMLAAMPISKLAEMWMDAAWFTSDVAGSAWDWAKKLYLWRAQTRQESNKWVISELTKWYTPEQQAEYTKFTTMLLWNSELSDKSASDVKKALENWWLPALFKEIKTPFIFQEWNNAWVEEGIWNILENVMKLNSPKTDNWKPKTELNWSEFYSQNISRINDFLTKMFAVKDAPQTWESLWQFFDKGINVAKWDNPTSDGTDLTPIWWDIDLSPIR